MNSFDRSSRPSSRRPQGALIALCAIPLGACTGVDRAVATASTGASEIAVASSADIDVRRDDPPSAASPTIDIHGRVVDELDRPIEEFALHLIHRDENNWFLEQVDLPQRVHTHGDFDLIGLAAGRWEITPRAERLAGGSELFLGSLGNRVAFLMTGTAEVSGIVLDPAGRPVANAEVSNLGDEPPHRTDQRGRFEFPVRIYYQCISARASGFAASECAELRLGSRDRRDGLELRLRPCARLRTIVLDEHGAPTSGWRVRSWRREGDRDLKDDQDADGMLRTVPGEAKLELISPDKWVGSYWTEVELHANETRELTLHLARPRPVRVKLRLTPEFAALKTGFVEIEPRAGLLASHQYWPNPVERDTPEEFVLDCPGTYAFRVPLGHGAPTIDRLVEIPDVDVFELELGLD